MVTFREEHVRDILPEIVPLTQKHYKEIAWHKDKIKLNPDYNKYVVLTNEGMCRTYTVRIDETHELIGYCVVFINPHIHYKEDLYASVDIVYIDPSSRGKMVGLSLFKFVENELKMQGVSVITYHVKTDHDFPGLMQRVGYTFSEKIYSKCIK